MTRPCQPSLLPEWSPQSAVMLTWPHAHGDWGNDLMDIEANFCEMAKAICHSEKLVIACYDGGHLQHVQQQLQTAGVSPEQYRLYVAPSNDIWVRDHGPLTVQCNMELSLLDFQFNGWGKKYAYDLDNKVTQALGHQKAFTDTTVQPSTLVLEGGSLEVDGSGTLLTTEHCLLSANRNGLAKEVMQQKLAKLFGIKKFLWLKHGQLEGDDTDSHVDTLARFCDRETIAYTACNDKNDSHWQELQNMKQELEQFRSATAKPYRLVPLPIPGEIFRDRKRLPANYCNFLVINGAVLVPVYNDTMDQVALTNLKNCFPERKIIPINSLALIRQFGSVHCASMQLPDGVVS